jgi:muramoyltetrapeptide carboxypeptidase
MINFKRAGILSGLKGLIIGGFTDLKDNDIPFGQTAEEIIMSHVNDYTYPVCFNFPAGHIADNRALILGKEISLTVESEKVSMIYSINSK